MSRFKGCNLSRLTPTWTTCIVPALTIWDEVFVLNTKLWLALLFSAVIEHNTFWIARSEMWAAILRPGAMLRNQQYGPFKIKQQTHLMNSKRHRAPVSPSVTPLIQCITCESAEAKSKRLARVTGRLFPFYDACPLSKWISSHLVYQV